MAVKTPSGKLWELRDVNRKLTQRAGLPGARVYDLSADSLRVARAKGLSDEARLPLALPGSWLVNSRAVDRVSTLGARARPSRPARDPRALRPAEAGRAR